MAHTKSGGSTQLGRDSESKRLGVKLYDGQIAKTGNIIIRQRGSKYIAGFNAKMGNDDTIYAIKGGAVKFTEKKKNCFNGNKKSVKIVNILPIK